MPVTLIGANTATPTFGAPLLPNGNTAMLIFSLRVMDSDGGAVSSNPALVYVILKPNNITGSLLVLVVLFLVLTSNPLR